MHRPFNFYFEISPQIQDYIITHARLEEITDIPLEEINRIFSEMPESEYFAMLNIERKGQKFLQ